MSSLSLGYVNSYQTTQMNLRGLSYWMLPSQPVSRLGYSRLAKVRSQQLVPGGASIFTHVPMCFTPDQSTGDYFMPRLESRAHQPSVWLRRSFPSARRAPWWGAHAAAHAEGAPAAATDKNSEASSTNTHRGSVSPKNTGRTESAGLDLCHVGISDGFHVPL